MNTVAPAAWRRSIVNFRADAARYVHHDDPRSKPGLFRITRALLAHQGLQAVAL